MNFDKKLGKFFKFGEMIRYRADNIPNNEELINLTQLCICVLDKIREKFGAVTITSGYRNIAYNKSVGGASKSQHITGQASDFIIKSANLKDVYKWIINNLEYDQVIFEVSGNTKWIHISYNIENNRKDNLIYINGTYYKYDFDKIEHMD